jgi:tyrosine-protein phosphatase OCA1
MVEEDLYRSGQPNELNFPFLERLNLKTIICLALEEPNAQLRSFVEEQDIRLICLGGVTEMETRRKAWNPLSEEMVLSALNIILDKSYYPLYISCHLGRDRTGAWAHQLDPILITVLIDYVCCIRCSCRLSSQTAKMAFIVNL